MHWYLVHTKPRQEKCALENLERQNYRCYLPMLSTEKLRQGQLALVDEPLFPRYLFIQLDTGLSAPSWSPIRSTRGVNRLVSFGSDPAKVHDVLIDVLMAHETAMRETPAALFTPGERVQVTQGPFAGLEGIYQMSEGERRVMVLIELMSKPVVLPLEPTQLRKTN
jgi:transcriptional antiterminator RfaH